MALRVSEIMNGELFSVGKEDTVDMALQAILLLGITGAPVLDAASSIPRVKMVVGQGNPNEGMAG